MRSWLIVWLPAQGSNLYHEVQGLVSYLLDDPEINCLARTVGVEPTSPLQRLSPEGLGLFLVLCERIELPTSCLRNKRTTNCANKALLCGSEGGLRTPILCLTLLRLVNSQVTYQLVYLGIIF